MKDIVIENCPVCGERHINPTLFDLIPGVVTIVNCPSREGLSNFILERYLRDIRKNKAC